MFRKNSFPITRQGLKDCKNYTDYVGIAKEFIENHPEVLPAALLVVVGASALLINPLASTVAFKTSLYDSGIVAFKYVAGGL